MKIRKRSFKEFIEDIDSVINLKASVVIFLLIFAFVYFVFFKHRKTPDEYDIPIEVTISRIEEKTTMTQSKYYGNRSQLVGWDIYWYYTANGKLVEDNTIILSLELSNSQKDKVMNLKENSKVIVKYNKDGMNYLELGE